MTHDGPRTAENGPQSHGTGSGRTTRRRPTRTQQSDLIHRAGHRCQYCQRMFGSVVEDRHGEREMLRVEFDHFVPYVYLQNNPSTNWIASCQLCNRYKGSQMFDSWQEACDYAWQEQTHRGWVTIWRATTASTHDPEQWAREWAQQLTHLAQFQRRGALADAHTHPCEVDR